MDVASYATLPCILRLLGHYSGIKGGYGIFLPYFCIMLSGKAVASMRDYISRGAASSVILQKETLMVSGIGYESTDFLKSTG